MAISNITTTADDGVERITNGQQITGTGGSAGTVDGECITLTASASRLETGTSAGEIEIRNSSILLDNDAGNNTNDADAVLNYGGRTVTTTRFAIIDSQLVAVGYAARHNIQVTEIIRSKIIEGDATGELFCYTSDGAILNDVLFQGINTWEVYGPPSEAFGIIVDNVNKAYLNWEAGRLDFFDFTIQNRPGGAAQADAWFGTGNSGNNQSWHWNNLDFNNQRIYFTSANNRYYDGFTATWEFQDASDFSPVQDVTVIFKDDFSGSMATRGTFLTGSDGIMEGTYDSQNRSSGSSQDRPTLFVVQNAIVDVDTGNPGAYTYPTTTITGDQGTVSENYDITPVEAQVEVRAYLYQRPAGFVAGDTFNITAQIGEIASDLSVVRYQPFLLQPDPGISETNATVVSNYTGLGTLDKLYDRIKFEWYDNDDYPYPVPDGAVFDLGTADLIVDGDAGSPFAYASGPDEITINPTQTPDIELVGTTTAVSTGVDDEITIAFPGGIQDDDVAYIFVGHSQSGENAWTTPSGWTIPSGLTEVQTGGSPDSVPGVSVFRRVLSSDSGSVTIENAGTNTSGIVAQMRVYRNVDTTTPEDVTPVTASGASGNPDPGSITPSNNGSRIIICGFNDSGAQINPTAPSGYANLVITDTEDET